MYPHGWTYCLSQLPPGPASCSPASPYLTWGDWFSCGTDTQQVWMAHWMLVYQWMKSLRLASLDGRTSLKVLAAWRAEREHELSGDVTVPPSLCFVASSCQQRWRLFKPARFPVCPAAPIIFQCEDFWIWTGVFKQGRDELLNKRDCRNAHSNSGKERGRAENMKRVKSCF